MILYDLKCRKGHVFEAWFRDSGSYDAQAAAGEVTCPACGSRKVEKAPMAPRLSKGGLSKGRPAKGSMGNDEPGGAPQGATGKAEAEAEVAQAAEAIKAMRELRRKVEENCDYVGDQFAEEARKIHYGEKDPQNIYGETSDDEAKALSDEGVTFARIPWPARHDS